MEAKIFELCESIGQLQKFIDKGELNELEDQGLIQAFEYTFELSWNLLKDYLQYEQAVETIHGSRDAFRIAFQRNLLEDGMGKVFYTLNNTQV